MILSFYLGKRCAFVYRVSKEVRGSKLRVIWGTITTVHGGFWNGDCLLNDVTYSEKLTATLSREFGQRTCQVQA